MPSRPILTAFLSHSFEEADSEIVKYFSELIESFDFKLVTATPGQPRSPNDGVVKAIQDSDCVIAICTRRDKIEGADSWKTSEWVLNEVVLAYDRDIPVIAFVENSVDIRGILNYITCYGSFNRGELYEGISDHIKLINTLQTELKEASADSGLSIACVKEDIVQKTRIHEDGSSELITEIRIKSLENNFSTTTIGTFADAAGDISVEALNYKVYSKSENRKVISHLRRNEKSQILLVVEFEPALKRDETTTYGFIKQSKKTNFMSLDEIEALIREQQFPLTEPYDFEGILINAPTDHFRKEIEFPRDFEVSDESFKVHIGKSESNDHDEYRRLEAQGAFSKTEFGNISKLVLDVENPKMGCCYIIYWKPPRTAGNRDVT